MQAVISLAAVLLFSACLWLPEPATGARILSISFLSSKSHKITYERLLHELGGRGHEVTIVSPVKAAKKVKNVREILTMDEEEFIQSISNTSENMNMFEMKEKGGNMNPFQMLEIFGKVCELSYDLPQVRALLSEKFDLVFMSAIFNECTTGFVYKMNTSIILISPASAPNWVTGLIGGPSPPSFVPNLFTGFGDDMTFYQRVINLLVNAGLTAIQDFSYKPRMEAIYREKLNDPTIPSSDEILRNASLIVSNSHFSLSRPRPFLPDVIEVGGMHCRPAEPLPKDLDDFVNSSGKDGFILFSMGSALNGSEMPEPKRKLILNTFAKLKQKVLWKWETETMADLPKNVKLSKWLPQQDILGHPKIRAFIMHGGFGGTTEAVYHGVPLVGIPMFGDQHFNMQKSEGLGYAVTLDYNSLTEEDFLNAINRVVYEPEFKENVQKLSKVFRDQPDKALDRAVYWTEYVLRHQGAPHLRSAARNLNFFQYHSIDVLGFLFAVIFVTLYLILAIFRFVFRKICGSSKKPTTAADKKKRN